MRIDVNLLLDSLRPVRRYDGPNRSIVEGPGPETQRRAKAELLRIASQTPQTRLQVIRLLIKVLEEPDRDGVLGIDHRWITAVNVLGELRAKEAVGVLVMNLNNTGEYEIVTSRHSQPVMYAIVKIGEPAVPRLIGALSDQDAMIRQRAADTLSLIGKPALRRLEDALRHSNNETKGGAAFALAIIGGKRARAAVEQAIERETDPGLLRKLKDAREAGCVHWGGCE